MNRTSRGKTRRPRTVKQPGRNATAQDPQTSDKKKIALLTRKLNEAVAQQTATSRELSRALEQQAAISRELRESLEQQTATSEVLEIIGHSTFDLQRVLERLLEKAVHLCGADRGFIFTQDGDVYRVAANYGHSAEFVEKIAKRYPISQDRGSASGRAILERRVVHIHDILADPEYRWAKDHHGEEEMHRTILAAPMLREDKIVGVIIIRRTRVEPFTEKQIALVTSFASQAVIAIENARLLNELSESLEQQTATSEVLGVISSSPGELEPVFQTMLSNATRLCEASYGALWLRQGGAFRAVALHGPLPVAFAEQLRSGVRRPSPTTGLGRVAKTGEPVHLHDLRAEQSYLDGDPISVAAADLGGIKTVVLVPMRKENEVVGAFAIYRQEVRPFTDKQIALVTNFASQAVIAIENARLLNELQDRTHDLQQSLEYQIAMSDVLKVISRSRFDLEPVLETVAETAARLCEAVYGAIFRRDGDVYRVAVAVGFSPEASTAARHFQEFLEKNPLVPGRGSVTGRVAIEGRAVHIIDSASDPEYTVVEATTIGKLRTQLGVPMLRDGCLIGVIVLARHQVEPFTEKQIELVTTFANQAVIAIENARLLNELRESLEQQTSTSDVLNIISRSPTDVQPVFKIIGERAERLCEAEVSLVSRVQGELIQLVFLHGVAEEGVEAVQRAFPMRQSDEWVMARAIRTSAVVHVPDLADARYEQRELARAGAYRSCLAVPMVREGLPVRVEAQVEPS
jgi:GAF domain-containing protein